MGLGSTGEFPHFSPDQRKRVLAALAEVATPLPVVANITDLRPRAAIELGRFAKTLGFPPVALMPPPFFPMAQHDVLAYFLHVADSEARWERPDGVRPLFAAEEPLFRWGEDQALPTLNWC